MFKDFIKHQVKHELNFLSGNNLLSIKSNNVRGHPQMTSHQKTEIFTPPPPVTLPSHLVDPPPPSDVTFFVITPPPPPHQSRHHINNWDV